MSPVNDGSRLAATEALLASLRSAWLLPHLIVEVGGTHPYEAQFLAYEVWVTSLGNQDLDPQAFPYTVLNSIVDGSVPENARKVFADVLAIKHGEIWDECFVQIRSGGTSQQTWSYRLFRLVQHPRPEAINWAKATGAALL
ncbi:MAG TPA: hypothetical protein VGH44_06765 [Candidatus Saccharimonadia bacterium]|jgi:hypothetical protein